MRASTPSSSCVVLLFAAVFLAAGRTDAMQYLKKGVSGTMHGLRQASRTIVHLGTMEDDGTPWTHFTSDKSGVRNLKSARKIMRAMDSFTEDEEGDDAKKGGINRQSPSSPTDLALVVPEDVPSPEEHDVCAATVTSFVLSANTEYEALDGPRLAKLFHKALSRDEGSAEKLAGFDISDPDNRNSWKAIRLGLEVFDDVNKPTACRGTPPTVIVVACQECVADSAGLMPHDLLACGSRLGRKESGHCGSASATQRPRRNAIAEAAYAPVVQSNFDTMTKPPHWNKMYIAMLAHDKSSLFLRAATEIDSSAPFFSAIANSWNKGSVNKGSVIVGAKLAGGRRLQFAGSHLDAQKPKTRTANIKTILKKLGDDDTNDITLLFGDLNYRVGARFLLPEDAIASCVACTSSKEHRSKWQLLRVKKGSPVKKGEVFGRCVAEGMHTSQEKTLESTGVGHVHYAITKVHKGDTQKCFGMLDADFYARALEQGKRKGKANSMYEEFKMLDSLQFAEKDPETRIWAPNHFNIPEYTTNVGPTYKMRFCSSGHRACPSLDAGAAELCAAENLDVTTGNGCFERLRKTKKCEAEPFQRCADLGWLDRVLYRDRKETTVIVHHTTLLIPGGVGDHAPLFVYSRTDNSE